MPLLYFNPLPPHGGRRIFVVVHQPCYYFNPLPPHGGRRIVLFWIAVLWHFNPLPPHGGRPPKSRFVTLWLPISIHSLHTEGDQLLISRLPCHVYFNPLPPHGGRHRFTKRDVLDAIFQSTPSTRRETQNGMKRGLLGARISIHSLHTEGDYLFHIFLINSYLFQSTPSTRRETDSNTAHKDD